MRSTSIAELLLEPRQSSLHFEPAGTTQVLELQREHLGRPFGRTELDERRPERAGYPRCQRLLPQHLLGKTPSVEVGRIALEHLLDVRQRALELAQLFRVKAHESRTQADRFRFVARARAQCPLAELR